MSDFASCGNLRFTPWARGATSAAIEVGLTPLHREGRAGTLATVIDISERKAAQNRQQFLLKELEHRSQNLFAVIRSIAARSLSPEHTVAEAKDAFEARLLALSRAHKMLGEAAWIGAPLAEIIKSELSAFEKNLRISGCDLFVNMTAAQQFALIVHELATNAAKYGALSSPNGKIAIQGKVEHVDGEQIFAISWNETGGPPVSKPRRKGFGSTILVDGGKRFGQAANLHFDERGLRYELRVPLNSIEAAQAPPAHYNVRRSLTLYEIARGVRLEARRSRVGEHDRADAAADGKPRARRGVHSIV